MSLIMTNVTTRNLTTFDLFKAIAVVFMIVDHLGTYFFPHDMWFHVTGRLFGVTWFFLMGYGRGRDIPALLLGGGLFLVAMNIITGMTVFPLNSLFMVILIRLTIDRIARFALAKGENLFLTILMLLVLYAPVNLLIENSTACFFPALLGWAIRNKDTGYGLLSRPGFTNVLIWTLIPIGCFLQWFVFPFTFIQGMLSVLSLMVTGIWLARTPAREYPALTAKCPPFVRSVIQFMGRHTLEIYVVHLSLFKLAAVLMGVGGTAVYGWFNWDWLAIHAHHGVR